MAGIEPAGNPVKVRMLYKHTYYRFLILPAGQSLSNSTSPLTTEYATSKRIGFIL
jgi:hypothetical protein